ncbi:hypothetical protein F5Y11DRAFT_343475 [Daldinia sp. FL1419]|nr:hypothetical protein F5Y11DRAFT_343475 [Daldinia sp. FL1419]
MDIDASDSSGVINEHLAANSLTLPAGTPELLSPVAARLDPCQSDSTKGLPNTEEPSSDLISLLEKLSNLNIRLMRHLNTIPEINTVGDLSQPEDKQFGIDETFHISQLFIYIISQLFSGLPPPQNSVAGNTPKDNLPTFSLDASSELLMYSCYLRLIETYDRILRLI